MEKKIGDMTPHNTSEYRPDICPRGTIATPPRIYLPCNIHADLHFTNNLYFFQIPVFTNIFLKVQRLRSTEFYCSNKTEAFQKKLLLFINKKHLRKIYINLKYFHCDKLLLNLVVMSREIYSSSWPQSSLLSVIYLLWWREDYSRLLSLCVVIYPPSLSRIPAQCRPVYGVSTFAQLYWKIQRWKETASYARCYRLYGIFCMKFSLIVNKLTINLPCVNFMISDIRTMLLCCIFYSPVNIFFIG